MDKAKVGEVVRLGLLLCGCLLGCETVNSPATPPSGKPDPFVEEIAKQDVIEKNLTLAKLKPDPVLKAIPLNTPLDQARAFMESHGFSCWGGTQRTYGTCLYCTAYRRKNQYVADKVVVLLYYQKKRVSQVEVTVECNQERPEHGFVARN